MRIQTLVTVVSLLLTLATSLPGADCASLNGLNLPDVRFTSMEAKPATEDAKLAHCEAEGVIGDEIGFVVTLPEQASWNGKFYMSGVGGFAGSYNVRGLYAALNRGYAAIMTDTGHSANGIRAGWALNHPERRVNYGYLGVHRTAAAGKAIVRGFYGKGARYSYFSGCSNGGRQALMEAQRYPDDFDGIIAGAPANDFTGILAAFTYNMQRIFPNPDDLSNPVITEDNRKLLQTTILEQCDPSDGVTDRILDDPRTCGFKLSSLPLCPGGEPAPHCLTIAQREAIAAVYEGPKNKDGSLFFGFPLGGEAEPGGWAPWITGPVPQLKEFNEPSLQFGFGTQGFKYLVFGDPEFDYTTYDFDDFEQDSAELSSIADAVNADLSGLRDAGGKLLLWHGWADPALTALASVDYYESVKKLDAGADEYLRLYMLPGVLHCGGGPGPDRVDWLAALEGWVERGEAPGTLTAAKVEEGETKMTRPLCVYPERAVYRGSGDPNDAASFECRVK
jgi:feruloyl esterase